MLFWILKLKIFLLVSTVPILLLLLVASVEFSPFTRFTIVLLTCFEIIFLGFYQWKSRHLENLHPLPKPKLSKHERRILFEKCMASVDNVQDYLTGWFQHANFEDVKRMDVSRFLAWGFFVLEPEDLDLQEQLEIDRMIEIIETRFNVQFPTGDNKLSCMRLNFDPILPAYRPFVYYLVIFLVQKIFSFRFRLLGFEKVRSNLHPAVTILRNIHENPSSKINYMIRRGSTRSTSPPIIFIHGIGVGVFAYFKFLQKLAQFDQTIVVIELPHVSTMLPFVYSSLVEKLFTPREFALEISTVLAQNGIEKATFVGHSLGSAVLSWCIKFCPDFVGRAIVIDPICFLLHHSDIAYNFIYRKPSTVDQLIFHWFASRELYIAWFLGRGFVWYDNSLFIQDIPCSIEFQIIMSGDDCIVPVKKILKNLPSSTNVTILPRLNHAQFLIDEPSENVILKLISSRFGRTGSSTINDSGYFSS